MIRRVRGGARVIRRDLGREEDLLRCLVFAAGEPTRPRPGAWRQRVRIACQYGRSMSARPAEFEALRGLAELIEAEPRVALSRHRFDAWAPVLGRAGVGHVRQPLRYAVAVACLLPHETGWGERHQTFLRREVEAFIADSHLAARVLGDLRGIVAEASAAAGSVRP